MRTDDFDYELPSGLIAQEPTQPRDACRLLVLHRASGQIDHRVFSDVTEYLVEGDVLVVNETRVLPARLRGVKDETGGAVEVLLLRERYTNAWECLVKPGRRLKPGAKMVFADGAMTGLVVEVIDEAGGRLVQFTIAPGGESFLDIVHRIGEVPLPPYITRTVDDPELYQTVFSRDERSAAAPTAGLHFTPELLERIASAGVRVETVELDVGIDTFRPVAVDDPEQHKIHTEHFRVPRRTAEVVNEAKQHGRRVIAVGTTSVRALESAWDAEAGEVRATEGATSLYVLPGYHFEVVDAMITNYHVPRSTLLMMVSSFAGRGQVLDAYELAKAQGYRFLSFGDAMLIL
ncbi:MAG: tRNA preQ1(34) S-adenosylmethionine ribosyltransferase-isomerase QueA [Coriobacteriia bacterium]|nr:tRNA preQ1(34) S-adenosylmethionine ribosyltransferase-isomerase QueA [Coriobacteriia bacterium]